MPPDAMLANLLETFRDTYSNPIVNKYTNMTLQELPLDARLEGSDIIEPRFVDLGIKFAALSKIASEIERKSIKSGANMAQLMSAFHHPFQPYSLSEKLGMR
jgi:hypothetical protein